MKTTRILLCGLLLIGMNLQAQKIYVRAGLGAAVSTAGEYVGEYTYTENTDKASYTKKGIGTGLPFVLAAGYMLNENIGLELGVDYFYGFNMKAKFTGANRTYDSKWHGQMLGIVPALVFTFPLDKIHPYARLGLKLGVWNNVIYKDHEVYTQGPSKIGGNDNEMTMKDYGGIAIGAQAALGTEYALSDLISLFGEIQLDGISYAPKHGKYTKFVADGEDILGSLTEKEKKWNYVKEVDYNKNIPNDSPDEYGKINYTFGNVGLVIGVRINFK